MIIAMFLEDYVLFHKVYDDLVYALKVVVFTVVKEINFYHLIIIGVQINYLREHSILLVAGKVIVINNDLNKKVKVD